MTNQRLVILIVAVAVVSVVAVIVSGGAGDDDDEERTTQARQPEEPEPARTTETAKPDPEPNRSEVPDDPEAVLGSAEYALTRPRNLRAALAVLQRSAQEFEGRPDYLRIAPGRIDTTLQRADKRKTLQIRANLKVAFQNEYDFPSSGQSRERGLRASEIDPQMPRRILNAIDLIRPRKSAARDLDYMVVQKSIIDGDLSWSAYLQSGPRPRQFGVEGGPRRIRLRVIG